MQAKEIACGGPDLILGEDGSLHISTGEHDDEPNEFIKVDTIDKPIHQIASSKNIGCALDTSGFLWVWGPNSKGELGLGDLDKRELPAPVVSLKTRELSLIAAGS
jgi:alpha-tubulin suppressor-like RCC1 family protein